MREVETGSWDVRLIEKCQVEDSTRHLDTHDFYYCKPLLLPKG
jgi:hypothetical protein